MYSRQETISFSLTKNETTLYYDWIDSLYNWNEINEKEDSFLLPVKFQFEPFELGICIKAIVGKSEIVLRDA
jgi:hypothetical protein